MQKRLEETEARYEELTRELSRPEVASDPSRLRQLGRQHAELQDIVMTYRRYREALRQAEEARALAKEEKDREMSEYFRAEAATAEATAADLERKIEVLLLPKDPNDEKDVVLEIRAGTGGQEAGLFAADLYEMYRRYAERRRWKTDVLSSSPSDVGGFKEVVLEINGKGAYSRLKHESGVHRVQRVPATESAGRIHTSAAGVLVLPEAEVTGEVEIDPNDLRIDVFRSSGPGGQSVNTTDSAVRITHLPTGIVVSCQNERSQLQNKARAMEVLRSRLQAQAEAEAAAQASADRRSQVRTVDRSERIRTYNFPENRISDHRVGYKAYNLGTVLDGELDGVLNALAAAERAETITS